MKKETKVQKTEAQCAIQNVSECKLADRKGKLIVSRQMIMEADANVLNEIFSNFFPMATEPSHQVNYWDSIMYYGISPHFEKVDEACVAPEYEIVLHTNDEGTTKFEKMVKRDYIR